MADTTSTAADAMKKKDTYVYFLYSEQQKINRNNVESKLSRTFVPGKVIVNGLRKEYTEMSTRNTNPFSDVKLIAEGWKSIMKYTEPKVVNAVSK